MTLALKNVVRRVGAETHIHETSLELEPGGFNTLLGTTLAGKTTLMQLMAGLVQPTSGEVWFGGKNVTGVPVQKRNVAMVFQQFINYPNLSVYENIASPLRVARVDEPTVRERVGSVAALLQLGPFLDRRPLELSGGQQQRTALARALVKDADLVLLDEPLANLDYKLREGLRDELPRLFAGRASTVVYATGEPSEALLLGGHTATVHEGRDHAVRAERRRLPEPGRPDDGAGLLRPADQHGRRRQAGGPDPAVGAGELDGRREPPAAARRRLHDRPPAASRAAGAGPGPGRRGRVPGADRRDQRIGERDPLRPRRADVGVPVARRARASRWARRRGSSWTSRGASTSARTGPGPRRDRSTGGAIDGPHRPRGPAAQLRGEPGGRRRLGAEAHRPPAGRTAARTRSSAPPAAARRPS